MASTLKRASSAFELHHYVRNLDAAAFDVLLKRLGLGLQYRLHCDDEDGLQDFWKLLAERSPDIHHHVCGPN